MLAVTPKSSASSGRSDWPRMRAPSGRALRRPPPTALSPARSTDTPMAVPTSCARRWGGTTGSIRRDASFEGWHELMVPAFFAAVMIVLFAMQYFSGASGLTTVLWAATMIAVLARLGLSVRENKRLLEQVRTDHLTGLGNQGRMQVDLNARCARAAEQPLTLMLLDLNGFKRYNDTFGHPAGDTMLERLGAQLREGVGADGAAYRMGGDLRNGQAGDRFHQRPGLHSAGVAEAGGGVSRSDYSWCSGPWRRP